MSDSTPENKTKIILKSINSEKGFYNSNGNVVAIFSAAHSDGVITVEQDLVLKQIDSKWIAEMPMLDFPPQKTITDAAWKLADWMEKMAAAIKASTFDEINLNNL
ncbi:MAG: hypothetical protein WAW36_19115 [Methylovulum miyakonense]|uniref:hypothetical protein n=1 Tax=Methylovulum miyakonense TaxID=645578 RepID=UPI003BB60DDD